LTKEIDIKSENKKKIKIKKNWLMAIVKKFRIISYKKKKKVLFHWKIYL
jgi:hypothetical protein